MKLLVRTVLASANEPAESLFLFFLFIYFGRKSPGGKFKILIIVRGVFRVTFFEMKQSRRVLCTYAATQKIVSILPSENVVLYNISDLHGPDSEQPALAKGITE